MKELSFTSSALKENIFSEVSKFITSNGFTIINKDDARPWGGFFVIDDGQSKKFINTFFSSINADELPGKLSPKFLIVAPGKRLSWQYHFRRAELWKVIGGEVGVAKSETDSQNPHEKYDTGTLIRLKQGERHRLIGLDNWGIVAEIWQHTDKEHPSDEEDIVRLQDDFGRN